jgi:ligand-binding sensor domain-containing protein
MQTFTAKESLTDSETETILEDREGNIWVGTDGGLDRFRYRNLIWCSLPERHYFSLAAADNSHVWAGTNPGDIVDVREVNRSKVDRETSGWHIEIPMEPYGSAPPMVCGNAAMANSRKSRSPIS